MALQFKDRVQETTTTTGTGTLTLAGAVTGYQAFTNALSNGDTCYYAISDLTNNAWEVGLGTFTTSGTTLARTTVIASSNSGSVVTLAAGTKKVFLTEPASVLVPTTGATMTGTLTSQTITPSTTGTYTLGDSSHYYTPAYISSLYLNSTAYFSGSSAGNVVAYLDYGMLLNGTSGNDTQLKVLQPGTAGAYIWVQSNNGSYISVIGSNDSAIFWEFGNFGQTDGMYFQTNNSGTSTASGYTTTPALKLDYSQNAFFYGNVKIPLAKKLNIATGTNASIGTAVLVAGTVTISTTAVTASSLIFLTCQVLGTVTVASALSIGTVTAGTSFVINSAVVTDTSTIGWWIIN